MENQFRLLKTSANLRDYVNSGVLKRNTTETGHTYLPDRGPGRRSLVNALHRIQTLEGDHQAHFKHVRFRR